MLSKIVHDRSSSRLFEPLLIANGRIELKHRVIYAPMTRLRGVPTEPSRTDDQRTTSWYPEDLAAEYYGQRATEGGLLISEATPVTVQGTGLPGAPGIFHEKQLEGWKKVTQAVHEKGGYIYAQLWHCGRATLPHFTGHPTICSSSEPWGSDDHYPIPLPGTDSTFARFKDFPPQKLEEDGIRRVIEEHQRAALDAMRVGFDGVEVHGANGYLPEQFLSSNINTRDDAYGGSSEKRTKFVLDLLSALASTIGSHNVGIRLSPFGLCHQTRSTQRIETWSHLCRDIAKLSLSYVHFIEPRWEQLHSLEDKAAFLSGAGLGDITLSPFRELLGSTPVISAGGWNADNCWDVIESGEVDALAFGRLFLANPDFVDRLRQGRAMNAYIRSTFYGPDRVIGYTDYPTWEEARNRKGHQWVGDVIDDPSPEFEKL